MANPLTDVPEGEPVQLVAGDTWSWQRSDLASDYPASEWTLSYQALLMASTVARIEITAAADGDGHVVTVAAAATAVYTPGRYQWFAFATRQSDSARIRIKSGVFTVEPNFAATTADSRSHAQRMLAAIEALLEGRATKDVASYTIAGRSLTKVPLDELMSWRDRYRAEVSAEMAARAGVSRRKLSRVSFTG